LMQDPSLDRYQMQLVTLMKLTYILDTAGEGVLGKGAPAMMYQAGLDSGREQARHAEHTDDLHGALAEVLTEGEEVWQIESWQDPGQETEWFDANGRRCTWLVFRRCPLITLSRRVGSTPGGLLCQALHGYIAGSLGRIMGCRLDLKVEHCGPRSCKILVEKRS